MRLIHGAVVHRLLGRGPVDALRRAHERPMREVRDLVLSEPGGDKGARNPIVLPAWQRDRLLGAKLVTVFPGNPADAAPLAANLGVYVAFDMKTGVPLLVADGAALTLRNTATHSALGVDLLTQPDAESLLMVGAGALAPHVIAAIIAVPPSISKIRIWNRTPEKAETVARSLAAGGIPADAVQKLDDALEEADIISSATMAQAPLIQGKLLRPGCHIDLIGGWNPQMREGDERAVTRARLLTDSRSQCRDYGDVLQPVEKGVIDGDDIVADLFELRSGFRSGRISPQDITLFKNCGGAHLDLFTAQELLKLFELRRTFPHHQNGTIGQRAFRRTHPRCSDWFPRPPLCDAGL
jgi:ornithine cyclodeaminase